MKIKSIDYKTLRNDEHLGFMTEVRNTLAKQRASAIDVPDELVALLNQAINNEDLSYKIVTKSSLTEEISRLDAVSDSLIVGFTTMLRAFNIHYDLEFQAASNRVLIVYKAFGDIRNKSYVAQTTDTVNFLQELNGKLQPDIALLGLEGWVTRIEEANNAFLATYNARQGEQAEKDALTRLRECRNETDEAYRAIVNRVNAGIVFNGEDKYKDFVIALNVSIDYYNNIMAQRRGRNKAKKEKEN